MIWLDVSFTWTQGCLLLVTYITHLTVLACDPGWFGGLCQFQCHCEFDVCNNLGECVSGRCADGYFGPSCQYVDLIFHYKTNDTPWYVYDNNDTSCNHQLNSRRVDITLNKALRFGWMRVVARVSVREYDFTLLLNDSEGICRFERDYIVDNITVDVTCDAIPLVTHLAIVGAIASEVCTVYISGGRDVALKQPANQTSTLGAMTADLAVDGNLDDRDILSSCSVTAPDAKNEWVVWFHRPQLSFRVLIYGSSSPQYKLQNLDIHSLSEARIKINTFMDVSCSNSTCDVNLESSEPSVAVIIRSRTNDSLALCSVQVFGETMCPDHKYGLDCDQECRCAKTEICNLVTGECTSGCPGYYGYLCDLKCGVSCVNSLCWPRSGDCIECQPGYFGNLCTNECPDGKFGAGCAYACSKKCLAKKCNRINGACLKCPPGKKGAFCNELDEIDYGVWPYVAVVLGCILLSMCCLCLRRTRAQRTEAIEKAMQVVPESYVPKKKVPKIPVVETETAV